MPQGLATSSDHYSDMALTVTTFVFTDAGGWSAALDPNMDSERTLVVIFGGGEVDWAARPLAHVVRAFPTSHIVGCSTAGEIHGTKVTDGTLVVAVARFEHTRLKTATATTRGPDDSFAAGAAIGESLNAPGLAGIFLVSDGQLVNGSALVRGLNSVLPPNVLVSGGLAGDGTRFERTWVAANGAPTSGMVAGVGFYGDRVDIRHGSKGGWDIFGIERVVTRSRGNQLYELDGRPALQLYKEYLGERAAGLPATALLFPLAIRRDRDDENRLVRTVLGVEEATQSMRFAGDMPEGSLVQLMRANFDRLIDGAHGAAARISTDWNPTSPVLSIAISCVGRRIVLGERCEEETEAALDVLPAMTTQVGFYSYGEISPYATGYCDLHNQTMTITAIAER